MNEFMSFYKFGAREGALWLESVTIQINSVEQYIRVMLFDSRCFTNYKKRGTWSRFSKIRSFRSIKSILEFRSLSKCDASLAKQTSAGNPNQ